MRSQAIARVDLAEYEDKQKTIEEMVMLGAADGVYFAQQFFPKTARQNSPEIHYTIWEAMDEPEHEHVGLELFRGSAKTTITRMNVAKRISYGVSRTIMIIGPEQKHAARSIRWLMRQVETNKLWAQTFGLKKGDKWSETECEIINESAGCRIFVIALGITGSTRGLNLDDYRPDFIVLDDCCDEENTGTPEQRKKIRGLLFGNITQSLAPRSESPFAKIVMLQTGLHKEDLINTAHNDPDWHTIKLGCFDEEGRSTWEERFPTEELLRKKRSFIEQNNLPYWLREMECKIVSFETAAFNTSLLKHYTTLPAAITVFAGIDPARETKRQTRAHKAAIVFIGVHEGITYLLEYWAATDANPEMLWQEWLRMATQWRPLVTGIETVAYQQTLEWYFNQRMMQTNSPFTIKPYNDRRKKPDRIRQAFTQRINMGTFQTRKDQHEFNEALQEYTDDVDIDILDAGAIALDIATPWIQAGLFGEEEDLLMLPSGVEDRSVRGLEFRPPCP